MKVKELIEKLQQCNPEAEVLTYDADVEQPAKISGFTHNDKYVLFQTDHD